MDERCSDCKPAIQCESLNKEIEAIKEDVRELKSKVGALDTLTAVNAKETKMVFNILNEIKDSIKNISEKLDVLEKKPGQQWNDLIKTVVAVLTTAAITYFISK